ncbi:acyclic terpene utilization AtuA family protein [Aquiflexum gelatinilyticum]|uniref:DUF1446 domain-containing protein n=1 Tax=Aquiflexum gelatinilyticum TaxID=2961943 RepID=A0A9X2P674_9BACT|nr:acyclic terpene utilization AtuA family protein [Aquiflexum gelatinilyticum]MCR9016778.1 DUF1446 domain-containing protein [Aquiflexum gelatinilyticum]
MKKSIRIGSGAGFSGDRIEPALILTEKGNLDYLVLECLAERTIALAQKQKQINPSLGYDPLLERRIEGLLPLLVKHRTRLVTNMGAANPLAAGNKIIEIAKKQGLKVKVAVVHGDDVLSLLDPEENCLETGLPLQSHGKIVSANAYLGIDTLLPALQSEADIILTGRVADPSLFLAPMVHEFSWNSNNPVLMGKGTVIGHLLECAGQITGGYFADPVSKPVDGLENLGFPFADILDNGTATISKVPGTGGKVSVQTAKEQLLYEVIDPSKYITPDVVADFREVKIDQIENDTIQISGGSGKPKPEKLKVSVGYEAGFVGEGEISYAGAHALERAKLAGVIIEKRIGHLYPEFRIDYIGLNSLHGTDFGNSPIPYEIRLRVSGKSKDQKTAALIGEEVEALYTNGPAGGGGARKSVRELLGVVSVLMDRNKVKTTFEILES